MIFNVPRLIYNTIDTVNNQSIYRLIGYASSNYAGSPKDWKLVIRYCFFINGIIISWCSKK